MSGAFKSRSGQLTAVLVSLVFGSCAAPERPFTWVNDLPVAPDAQVTIGPRDVIRVVVRNQTALSGEFPVGDDGSYLQPTLGNIPAEGKTPNALALELQNYLKDLLVKPEVTVSIVKFAPVRVNVVGEVKTPGIYELTRERGVLPALAAAGWLTEFAHTDRIFVLRSGTTDQRVRFQARELTSAEPHAARFRLRDGDVVIVE
jgi:polysaccharide export outer membrane protein